MQTSSTNQSAIVPLRQIESDEHDAMSAQHAVVSVVLEVQLMLSGCIMCHKTRLSVAVAWIEHTL
jgi:hypothetical protein|eukprot:scaffold1012_cov189-Alexandrium_tamarense.AAC.19